MKTKQTNVIRNVEFKNKYAKNVVNILKDLLNGAKKKEYVSLCYVAKRMDKTFDFGCRGDMSKLEMIGAFSYLQHQLSHE